MTKRYFVTGTDTEVGKTVASCALLQAARSLGYREEQVCSSCVILLKRELKIHQEYQNGAQHDSQHRIYFAIGGCVAFLRRR